MLFFEENKESAHDCPELAHNKSKSPTNNLSFGFGNFNTKFRPQFFYFKRQSGFSFFNSVFNVFIVKLPVQQIQGQRQ